MSESDGPAVLWGAEHGNELVGLRVEAAAAIVRTAGFRPAVFVAASGHALAAMQGIDQILLIAADGAVIAVRA